MFVNPYRRLNELNEVERFKLGRATPSRPPSEWWIATPRRARPAIDSIPGEIERLKWVGIYPQRQGGNAFMLRIKVPGGHLKADQVREIGVIADAFAEGPEDSEVFGNRYADITTRQDVQLHWIRIEDVPRIWQRLWDVGVTTVQACGDSNRNVTLLPGVGGGPQRGVRLLPGRPGHLRLLHRQPRVLEPASQVQDRGDRVPRELRPGRDQRYRALAGRAEDGTLGFNLLAGGGLSDGERMASDIDVFIAPDEAVEICRGMAQVFGELGTGRTGAWPACATWSRSWGPRLSVPPSTTAPPSRSNPQDAT